MTDDFAREMVLVPAGTFEMGATQADIDLIMEIAAQEGILTTDIYFIDEQPAHTVAIEAPFWLDRLETTQADYRECVAAGACTEISDIAVQNSEQQPVLVSWLQAADYCAWRGGRLPTEPEWAFAARGPDRWIYPWGNEWVASNVNQAGHDTFETYPVGSFPTGASWVGALDIAGNAWEWVSTIYAA